MRANHFRKIFACMWIDNIVCPIIHSHAAEMRHISMLASWRMPSLHLIPFCLGIYKGRLWRLTGEGEKKERKR